MSKKLVRLPYPSKSSQVHLLCKECIVDCAQGTDVWIVCTQVHLACMGSLGLPVQTNVLAGKVESWRPVFLLINLRKNYITQEFWKYGFFLRRSRASDRWEELERRKMLSRGFLWRRKNLLTTPTTLIWKEAHGSDQKSKFSDVVESKRKKASNFQTLLFSQTASHSSLQE